MADTDSTYRMPRQRAGMEPNTRRLALIAGGIGGLLVLVVGAWSLTGLKPGGVPVVEADARPLRVKPDKAPGPEVEEVADSGKSGLAPTPEAPAPQALKAQAAAAAAAAVAPKPPLATQPVALTSPVAPAPQLQAAVPPVSPPRSAASPTQAAGLTTAKPTPVAGGTQVQLAALQTEQAALAEWSRLEKRMPDVLGGRKPVLARAERDGKIFWRLRTGGFADPGQATSFCDRVKAKGGTCSVASF